MYNNYESRKESGSMIVSVGLA